MISFEDFTANCEKRFATIKQIEIAGEASNHLSDELKRTDSEIEWTQINGFRNISIHKYFGVNLHIVWAIAKNDLPVLKGEFYKTLKIL